MQRTIQNGTEELVFTIKRSRRRRTVALRVEPSGVVTVFAPPFVWGPFIDRFVRQQSVWIQKKLAYFKERAEREPLTPPITQAMRLEYTQTVQERLPGPIERFSRLLDVAPRSVKVANQRSRWGSCSRQGDLRFSWRLAMLPEPILEYVVIHELAHLKAPDHSPRFWAVVHSVLPNYKERRKWLRQNSWRAQGGVESIHGPRSG